MLRQIKLLVGVQWKGLFGINQALHTKDRKKRLRFLGLGVLWALLILMMAAYMGGFSFLMVMTGIGGMVPLLLFNLASLVILFFTVIKAGSEIFKMSTYELLVSLPVSGASIVISRFFTMYATNLLMSLIVMLPGLVVYGIYERPDISFYLFCPAGILILPMLPITLATAAGALVTAVSSRMRHKSLVSAALTMLLAIAVLGTNIVFSENIDGLTEAGIRALIENTSRQLRRINPASVWFSRAVEGSLTDFGLLLAVSVIPFVGLLIILSHYFHRIASALNAAETKRNYRVKTLEQSTPLLALWKRERKRYFASSIYVSNTMMGYILMAVVPAALLFVGKDKVEALLGMPDIVSRLLPLVLALIASIMSTTACSISLEGRQWWILKSLPLRAKTLFDSKILWNLTLSAPFWAAAVLLSIRAAHPSTLEGIWIALMPAAYILFTAVAGITVNVTFPVFDWENEIQVVKQSASTLVAMLVGVVGTLIPITLTMVLPERFYHVVMSGTLIGILLLTAILYQYNNRKTLMEIG